MKKFALLSILVPVLCFGQNNVQDYVKNVMMKDKEMSNLVVAFLAVAPDGSIIAGMNPDMPLAPASNTKLITTGTAMLALGPEYRFRTSLSYDGQIDGDGLLKGNVYIVGGADPTLGSKDDVAYPVDSIFAEWVVALRNAGIKKIEGRICGDASFLDDEIVPGDLEWDDIGTDYGHSACGLSFAENLSDFEVRPGKAEGDPAVIRPIAPYSPDMTYLNEVVTSAGRGMNIGYNVSDICPVGKFEGSVGADRRVDTIACANKFTASTCAAAFEHFLTENGIECLGYGEASAPDSANFIFSTFSPTLSEIASVTNHISNNFYAETIFKTFGREFFGEGSRNAASKGARYLIDSLGVSLRGYTQADGSGLSRHNYISPRFFCNFLSLMERSDCFEAYLAGLPQPGGEGTLSGFLRQDEPALKQRIHAKSGSLDGVKCYSGYVETEGGYIKFSIMLNNYSCPTSRVQPIIEGFVKQLTQF